MAPQGPNPLEVPELARLEGAGFKTSRLLAFPQSQPLSPLGIRQFGKGVECLFINTAYLEVSFRSEALSPGEKVEIPISFYPREAISYHEIVTFEINGILQRTVEFFGKGIEMKIDVVEPPQKVLKFGAIPPGHIVKKGVTLVNNSVTFVVFSLSFVASIPELQEAKVLTMSPSGEITLKPQGGTCHVEVTFSPKSRILPFSEEVLLECQGVLNSLFIVQGCCQGIEVHLDQDHIPFGAVVLRSQASRRIVMQNSGDLGVGPDFSIKPIEGYISPGTSVPFEVTFHPCEQSQDICYENLPCHIQGGEPVVNFICQVRGKQTQTIMLSNKTNQPWILQPIIEGEQWKGPEYIRVEAHQQNKPYEVTYRPLAMNVENKKDQGSVFFPLPDGTGLLYLLQGTAEPPKSAGNIMREIPCKTSYTELLPITNWLNKLQRQMWKKGWAGLAISPQAAEEDLKGGRGDRKSTVVKNWMSVSLRLGTEWLPLLTRFRVILDMIKPEKLEVTTTLKTLDYTEVPASTKKDHKLTFFSYKEGMYTAKVTFRNEATQEFLFYLITFKATPCGPLGTLELTTAVRQSTASSVKVENPLHYQVSFNTDCRVPDINLPPQFMVPAQSEVQACLGNLPGPRV
ncbi:Hydrocephalus-inducing protein-like protein, partial [Ophiophagus hannah]